MPIWKKVVSYTVVIAVAFFAAFLFIRNEMAIKINEYVGPDGSTLRTPVDSNGLPHGVAIHYLSNGKIIAKTEYSHGHKLSHTEFWPSGTAREVWTEGSDYQIKITKYPDTSP